MNNSSFEDNVRNNLSLVVEELVKYFGRRHEEKIINNVRKVEFCVLKEGDIFSIGEEQFAVGIEPLCIKRGEKTFIIFPVSLVRDSQCNVVFVHLLIHSITGEVFLDREHGAIGEVLVDYVANIISKAIEKQGINISESDKPSYDSNSSYSSFFPVVENYFERNKEKIIDCMMGSLALEDEEYQKLEEIFNKEGRDESISLDNKSIAKK